MYDSSDDTLKHREEVAKMLDKFVFELGERADGHDQSKLENPEKVAFDMYSPKLKETVYGSEEYREYLRQITPAVQHHYIFNRHHPEHFADGIDGMNLIDLIEMLCDWKAATKRMKDGGNIAESLRINKIRFNIGEQLALILQNTIMDMD